MNILPRDLRNTPLQMLIISRITHICQHGPSICPRLGLLGLDEHRHTLSAFAEMSSHGHEKAVYASEKGAVGPPDPQYEEGEVVGEVIDFGEKKELKYENHQSV